MSNSHKAGDLISSLGYLKEEGVFSNIECNSIDQSAGQPNGSVEKNVRLYLPNTILTSDQLLKTQALFDENGAEFIFPCGSVIREWVVQRESALPLDDNFSFIGGYINDSITDSDSQRALATRVSGLNNQITGKLLNSRSVIHLDQKLNASQLAAQNTLYGNSSSISYAIIAGNSYVSELKSLKPAVTATAGTLLNITDLVINIRYSPPVIKA